MNAPPQRRNWRSPETRAASLKALTSARLKAHDSRRAEKIEGMAWARAWREANNGRDWSLPATFACKCPTCGSLVQ